MVFSHVARVVARLGAGLEQIPHRVLVRCACGPKTLPRMRGLPCCKHSALFAVWPLLPLCGPGPGIIGPAALRAWPAGSWSSPVSLT